jgi:hypothetical protein
VLAFALAGCQERTFIPSEVVRPYVARQSLGQLEPGWVQRSVRRDPERPTRIVHTVEVPPEVAGELVMMSGGERARLVAGVVCPDGADPIWQELDRGQDVVVDIVTESGPVEQISCRRAL